MASTTPKLSLLAIALAVAAGPEAAFGVKPDSEEALGQASWGPALGERGLLGVTRS